MTFDPSAQPTHFQPAAPPRRKRRGLIAILVSVGVLLIASIVVVGVLVVAPPAAANEIVLDAAAEVGADPFSSDPFAGEPPVLSTPAPSAAPTNAPAAARPVSAATPGLYGGTQDVGRCDAAQLVAFLEANPAKAAAWVAALNADPLLRWSGGALTVADIRAYVGTLTSLVLMSDVRVTNHGFANGAPTPIQSVLEAGTAVLVDQFGVPRARCFCGNPLIPAKATSPTAQFKGTPWPGFDPNRVVTLTGTPEAIRELLLGNPLDPNAPLTRTPLTGGPTPPSTPAPTATAPPEPSPSAEAPVQQTPVPPPAGLYAAGQYAGDPGVRNTVSNNTGRWLDVYYYDESGTPIYTNSIAPGVQDAWIESDLPGVTWVVTSGSPDVISSHLLTPGATWTIN